MKFKNDKVEDFIKIFFESKDKILEFKGCHLVELLNDCNDKTIMCTFSIWESEQCLQDYRNSEFFKSTWDKTKKLFEAKAEANSYNVVQATSYRN